MKIALFVFTWALMISTVWGNSDLMSLTSKDGKTIVFEERFNQTQRTVPKEDYLEYKASLERIADYARKPVFLKKTQEDPV